MILEQGLTRAGDAPIVVLVSTTTSLKGLLMALTPQHVVNSRVRYVGASMTGTLHTGDTGTIVSVSTTQWPTVAVVMDDPRGRTLRHVPDHSIQAHWTSAGDDFAVIEDAPAQVTFTQAQVDAAVREAKADLRREIGAAIWQAKIDNGLCSEVERFLEQHDMEDCIPMKVKVEVYLTVPRGTGPSYLAVSEAQELVTNALDSAGVEYDESDAEQHEDY